MNTFISYAYNSWSSTTCRHMGWVTNCEVWTLYKELNTQGNLWVVEYSNHAINIYTHSLIFINHLLLFLHFQSQISLILVTTFLAPKFQNDVGSKNVHARVLANRRNLRTRRRLWLQSTTTSSKPLYSKRGSLRLATTGNNKLLRLCKFDF